MNADEFTIRLIEPSDSIDDLTALLHRAYADHHKAGRVFYASYQTPDQTRKRISDAECWLALRNRQLVGTVTIRAPHRFPADYPTPQSAGSFQMLAIEPELRGSGLGNRLLLLAEDRIHRAKLEYAVFDTSSLATDLLAWYERRNYKRIGTYRWDVTNYQSIVMARRLN